MIPTNKKSNSKMFHFGDINLAIRTQLITLFKWFSNTICSLHEIKNTRNLNGYVYATVLGDKDKRREKRLSDFTLRQLVKLNISIFILYLNPNAVEIIKTLGIPGLSSKHKTKGAVLSERLSFNQGPTDAFSHGGIFIRDGAGQGIFGVNGNKFEDSKTYRGDTAQRAESL